MIALFWILVGVTLGAAGEFAWIAWSVLMARRKDG